MQTEHAASPLTDKWCHGLPHPNGRMVLWIQISTKTEETGVD
jgi:hypothetical protein